jgi:hypothetical protein
MAHDDMEAVGDLRGLRSAQARRFGILPTPIPAHGPNGGVLAYPLLGRICLAIWHYEGLSEVLSTLNGLFSSL